ncbi:unnamed protein product [Xylocopa violacea]|uniref:Uncharacterized protein n=1 Tax=Xylocopa violacea TaxID=135666 RepID=A0ABP1NC36_XYLVO
MVHANINDITIKEPYGSVKKDKNGHASSEHRQQSQQQQSANKNDKYGSWGPIYKNKQNFVDMHVC